MQHALVAGPDCAGLVRINSGNYDDLVSHFILDIAQSRYVLDDRILVIRGARADDQKTPWVSSLEDVLNDLISLRFELLYFLPDRILLLHLERSRQLSVEYHIHFFHK